MPVPDYEVRLRAIYNAVRFVQEMLYPGFISIEMPIADQFQAILHREPAKQEIQQTIETLKGKDIIDAETIITLARETALTLLPVKPAIEPAASTLAI